MMREKIVRPVAPRPLPRRALLPTAAVLLGLGLGGFFDGILLHQILQWHGMLSSVIPPIDPVSIKINMVWDGFFHGATWMMTVAGIALLVQAAKRGEIVSGRRVLGFALAGWGLFNFVEGLIDHQILGIHHVHPGEHQLAWDLGFLATGPVLLALGWLLVGSGAAARRRVSEPPTPSRVSERPLRTA